MAIAFDAFTDGNYTNSATTHTFSHTCTGSDRILFVTGFTNTSSDYITGITYNGVAMTLVNKLAAAASRYAYIFYLVAPATGANNVVLTASSSSALGGNASSYTGASQTGQPDASSSQTIGASPVNNSVTTVADNCWSILTQLNNQLTPSVASTNSTLRGGNTTFTDAQIFDNNTAITPAGSYTMTTTNPDDGDYIYLMASFAPAVAGPLLKTINGKVIADVKSYNNLT